MNQVNTTDRKNKQNGIIENKKTDSPQNFTVSSPKIQSSSVVVADTNPNVNGIIKKTALKAALSLDPSTLYRATIPYEKIAFSQPPSNINNTETKDIKNVSKNKIYISIKLYFFTNFI